MSAATTTAETKELLEAWLFSLRSRLTNTPDYLYYNKDKYVYEEGRLKRNTQTKKTLDEEALENGLGYWFPKPAKIIRESSGRITPVPILFGQPQLSIADYWHELLPACVACCAYPAIKIPVEIVQRIFQNRNDIGSVWEFLVNQQQHNLAEILFSNRWLKNPIALKYVYTDQVYNAGCLFLYAATTLNDLDPPDNVNALIQQHSVKAHNSIPPIIALLAKLGCFKQAVWEGIVREVKVKSAEIPNYEEATLTSVCEKLGKILNADNALHWRNALNFLFSCDTNSNKVVANIGKGSNDLQTKLFNEAITSTTNQDKVTAVVQSGEFVLKLVDILVPNIEAAKTIWNHAVYNADTTETRLTNVLSTSDEADNATLLRLFPPTAIGAAGEATLPNIPEVTWNTSGVDYYSVNECPASIRTEGAEDNLSITFSHDPEISAFRLYDTQLYAARYAPWLGGVPKKNITT